MKPEYFFRLAVAIRGLRTDPATAADPIKRTFLCDGPGASPATSIFWKAERTSFTSSRITTKPAEVKDQGGGRKLINTIEIEGEVKPALIAETLIVLVGPA